MPFSAREKQLILSLLLVPGCGTSSTKHILKAMKQHDFNPNMFWVDVPQLKMLRPKLKKFFLSNKNDILEQNYLSVKKQLKNADVRVLFLGDAEYPVSLSKTENPPLVLFARGKVSLLAGSLVAVVGTRNVTSYGRHVTRLVTRELVAASATIVSGCMYGVDTIAQQTALDLAGNTIGVLGFGFNHCYPRFQQPFLDTIIQKGGLLITEHLPEVGPRASNFLRRNRIIAGMCQATVVTQAAQKSGSHYTAVCAAELGRSVFAVPGPISDPYCEGTKWLVNQGATLVSSGVEIAEYLSLGSSSTSNRENRGTAFSDQLLQVLAESPQDEEELVVSLNTTLNILVPALSKLEIAGRIATDGILWYIR